MVLPSILGGLRRPLWNDDRVIPNLECHEGCVFEPPAKRALGCAQTRYIAYLSRAEADIAVAAHDGKEVELALPRGARALPSSANAVVASAPIHPMSVVSAMRMPAGDTRRMQQAFYRL
jgi:hypothetical protein